MTGRIKRTTPWAGGFLSPGDSVPKDVPPAVLDAWRRNGKVEADDPAPKGSEKV